MILAFPIVTLHLASLVISNYNFTRWDLEKYDGTCTLCFDTRNQCDELPERYKTLPHWSSKRKIMIQFWNLYLPSNFSDRYGGENVCTLGQFLTCWSHWLAGLLRECLIWCYWIMGIYSWLLWVVCAPLFSSLKTPLMSHIHIFSLAIVSTCPRYAYGS